MNMKTIGLILLVGGVVVALLGALADVLSIGNRDGFGYQQLTLVIVGLIAAAVGAYLGFVMKPKATTTA